MAAGKHSLMVFFVPSQRESKNMSHDPAACKIALVSLFWTVVIDYF